MQGIDQLGRDIGQQTARLYLNPRTSGREPAVVKSTGRNTIPGVVPGQVPEVVPEVTNCFSIGFIFVSSISYQGKDDES